MTLLQKLVSTNLDLHLPIDISQIIINIQFLNDIINEKYPSHFYREQSYDYDLFGTSIAEHLVLKQCLKFTFYTLLPSKERGYSSFFVFPNTKLIAKISWLNIKTHTRYTNIRIKHGGQIVNRLKNGMVRQSNYNNSLAKLEKFKHFDIQSIHGQLEIHGNFESDEHQLFIMNYYVYEVIYELSLGSGCSAFYLDIPTSVILDIIHRSAGRYKIEN